MQQNKELDISGVKEISIHFDNTVISVKDDKAKELLELLKKHSKEESKEIEGVATSKLDYFLKGLTTAYLQILELSKQKNENGQ